MYRIAFSFLDSMDPLFSLFVSLYFVFFASFFYYYIKRGNRNKSRNEKAFKSLSEGFNSEVPIDESDIIMIFKRLSSYSSVSYVTFLEDYLLYLRNEGRKDIKDFAKVNDCLKAIISREHVSKPYEGIAESERRMMLSIEECTGDESIKSVVRHNLNDLSESIRKTESDLKRARTTNKWTIPLAIAGLVLTILSFVMGSRLSEKDLNKFDQHVSTIIEKEFSTILVNQGSTNMPNQE